MLLVGGCVSVLLGTLLARPVGASPPGIPDPETARAELAELATAPEGSMAGYARERFPHWITTDGCTTRQWVLRRDGEGVEVDEDCRPTSGTWHSPYDGATLDAPSEVDIDHVVPLAESWRSGAAGWTEDRRRSFANDLENPQLIAVSAAANRSKGDQDPADWQPVEESYHCTYAAMWIDVKYEWGLTVDEEERAALQDMLGACGPAGGDSGISES
ncbi:HNH endonuclease family protein [Streptomyces hoynatensis]|uniref:HNH endonuclease family protein n=1 Tax=Streptomyces hoynatensis TaxID=1141874 RepID=UPI001F4D665D|nr:HNH endonuclease family protein [Streptomyces hoynatensis]